MTKGEWIMFGTRTNTALLLAGTMVSASFLAAASATAASGRGGSPGNIMKRYFMLTERNNYTSTIPCPIGAPGEIRATVQWYGKTRLRATIESEGASRKTAWREGLSPLEVRFVVNTSMLRRHRKWHLKLERAAGEIGNETIKGVVTIRLPRGNAASGRSHRNGETAAGGGRHGMSAGPGRLEKRMQRMEQQIMVLLKRVGYLERRVKALEAAAHEGSTPEGGAAESKAARTSRDIWWRKRKY